MGDFGKDGWVPSGVKYPLSWLFLASVVLAYPSFSYSYWKNARLFVKHD